MENAWRAERAPETEIEERTWRGETARRLERKTSDNLPEKGDREQKYSHAKS